MIWHVAGRRICHACGPPCLNAAYPDVLPDSRRPGVSDQDRAIARRLDVIAAATADGNGTRARALLDQLRIDLTGEPCQ